MRKKGLLIKGVGGLYEVLTEQGTVECRARGIFRKQGNSPLVGDRVVIEKQEDGSRVLAEIEPRKNSLIRPPLANLDKLVLIVSTCDPYPNLLVIDKLIAICEHKEIEPVLVITKSDCREDEELFQTYTAAGFQVMKASGQTGEGVEAVRNLLSRGISALAGNSGVGKSTLLNAVCPELSLQTGEISKKLGRGRHTTRHIQLYPLDKGFVADTPGFSSLDFTRCETILKEDLPFCFREFSPYVENCRFTGCLHTARGGCAVVQAVEEGKIPRSRYENYLALYEQVKDIREWELKEKDV